MSDISETPVAEDVGVVAPGSPPRRRMLAVVAAASVAPVVYLWYVVRFARAAIYADEWNALAGLSATVHGRPSVAWYWSQYGEPRIPLVRVYLLAFAKFDHLDNRHIVVANAVIQIGCYVLILVLANRYLRSRLGPFSALALGIVWLSLVNTENAVWAFDVGWFVVNLGFLLMIAALALPRTPSLRWTAVAVACAVVASLAWIHGFFVWPVGALGIWWMRPRGRPRRVELAVWLGAFATTAVVYAIGYDAHNSSCVAIAGCRPWTVGSEPFGGVRFLAVLLGNVFPDSAAAAFPPNDVVRYEIIGAVLLLGAVAVVVDAWRHRRDAEAFPLPMFLVTFGILVELGIVKGRTGAGIRAAIIGNRYVIAALLVATGILLRVIRYIVEARGRARSSAVLRGFAITLVVAVLAIQVTTATRFGMDAARFQIALHEGMAHASTNIDRLPPEVRECVLGAWYIGLPVVRIAERNQWGEFGPRVIERYRSLGPPAIPPSCTN